MKKLIFIQLLIVLLLSSCLVGKRYTRPEMKVPENICQRQTHLVVTGDTTSAFAAKDTTLNLQWFELFSDTVLNTLITQALDSNTNLNIAVLRVQQSRSVYKNSKAQTYGLQLVIRHLQILLILLTIISNFLELHPGSLISGVRSVMQNVQPMLR